MESTQYLTVKEVAKRLKRRKEWIYYLLGKEDPRLTFIRPGTEYLVTAESVATFQHRPRGNPGNGGQAVAQDRQKRPATRARR